MSIEEQIKSHERQIEILEFQMQRNVKPKSIFKGNALSCEIWYHKKRIEELKRLNIGKQETNVFDLSSVAKKRREEGSL
jgi:hypothetical protein